jgi:hypothetical protein
MGPSPGQGAIWFVEWVSASEARPNLEPVEAQAAFFLGMGLTITGGKVLHK